MKRNFLREAFESSLRSRILQIAQLTAPISEPYHPFRLCRSQAKIEAFQLQTSKLSNASQHVRRASACIGAHANNL
jgi:hypothetical protein